MLKRILNVLLEVTPGADLWWQRAQLQIDTNICNETPHFKHQKLLVHCHGPQYAVANIRMEIHSFWMMRLETMPHDQQPCRKFLAFLQATHFHPPTLFLLTVEHCPEYHSV
jgi:hypothetical protein